MLICVKLFHISRLHGGIPNSQKYYKHIW